MLYHADYIMKKSCSIDTKTDTKIDTGTVKMDVAWNKVRKIMEIIKGDIKITLLKKNTIH